VYQTVKISQVLSIADAQVAFSSWVLGGGMMPPGYTVETVAY
jgi:hypothetical protein